MHKETKNFVLTRFIVIFTLLPWSGMESAISPRSACILCWMKNERNKSLLLPGDGQNFISCYHTIIESASLEQVYITALFMDKYNGI